MTPFGRKGKQLERRADALRNLPRGISGHWTPSSGSFCSGQADLGAGVDIDAKHSRAIVQEIGERLRGVLKEEPECPGSLRTQIDRLRELEGQSPSIVPAAERWDKRRR